MNQKIYNQLEKFCERRGFEFCEDDILEILQEEEQLHEELIDCKRYWDEYFNVVEVDGMLIGYYDAKATGDLTPTECGWYFIKDNCCEIEEQTETRVITTYKPISKDQ